MVETLAPVCEEFRGSLPSTSKFQEGDELVPSLPGMLGGKSEDDGEESFSSLTGILEEAGEIGSTLPGLQ